MGHKIPLGERLKRTVTLILSEDEYEALVKGDLRICRPFNISFKRFKIKVSDLKNP